MTPTLAAGQTLLSVENVSLSFGANLVLRDVNLRLANLSSGQVVGVLGGSGSGKTSLMRIIAGLQKPTSGQAFVGAERTPVHAGLVGMVAQQYPLFANRTVLGNLTVAAGMAPNHPSGKQAGERAREILEEFELSDKADRYPVQLSGGQRQKIAIAQQILSSDHLLLLDEPTAGLDPVSKKKVCRTVSKIAARDSLSDVIIVSHDVATVVAMAHVVYILGRERDAVGNPIPGARIVQTYDLAAIGLGWREDVRRSPAYREMVEEIQDRFDTL